MIRIAALSYSYPKGGYTLRVSSLEVRQGESLAIIGQSGSGKTTLLHLLAGILKADEGAIEVDGQRLDALSESERRAFRISRVGSVFQALELLDYLTVLDNVLHPFRIHPVLKLTPRIREEARALAVRVGLGDKLKCRPGTLSQGERQRVALCRAVLPRPALILADEATGHLDPANKQRVVDFLLESSAQTGSTLIAVTHDHEILDRFAHVVDLDALKRKG